MNGGLASGRPVSSERVLTRSDVVHRSAVALVRAVRPKQWVKNVLVFAAPGAAGILFGPDVLERTGLAFLVFSMVASAGYLVNDVMDARTDRTHETKRHRPVASRELSPRAAVIAAAVLFIVAVVAAAPLGSPFVLSILAYTGITCAYSLGLKRVAVVDLMLVAACYVVRAIAGAAVVAIEPSMWFLALVSASAMAVVAGRRIADVRGGAVVAGRSAPYSLEYLRGIWILGLGIALTTYCLWAVAVPHDSFGIAWSQVSIAPFALALLRYAYVLEGGRAGEPEDVFASDRVIQVAVVAWCVVYGLGVYLR